MNKKMKKEILTMVSLALALSTTASCGSNNDFQTDEPTTPVAPQPIETNDVSVRNLTRATALFDAAMQHYISGDMKIISLMARIPASFRLPLAVANLSRS